MELSEEFNELKELRSLLNEISISFNTEEILKKCLVHLTETQTFNFQFAVINLIDPFSKTVKAWIPSRKHYPELQHEIWRDVKLDTSINKLPDNDIILIVSKNDCVIKVKAEKICFLEGTSDEEIILDPRVYKKWGHERLTRYFIPLMDATSGGESFTFGVLEMGFLTNTFPFKETPTLLDKIKIYIDNLVQVYYKLYVQEKTKQFDDIINSLTKTPSHQVYLKRVIETLCIYLECDKGQICIASFNDNFHEWNPAYYESRYYKFDSTEIEKIYSVDTFLPGYINPVEVQKKTYQDRHSNYIKKLDRNFSSGTGLDKINSFYSVPFMNNDNCIGVITLYSAYPNYFDTLKRNSISNIVPTIYETYVRKKTHHLLSKLVLPLNIFGEIAETLKSTMELIKEYFVGANVKIFLDKTTTGHKPTLFELNEINIFSTSEAISVKNRLGTNELSIDKDSNRLFITSSISLSTGRTQKEVYGFIQVEVGESITISEDDKIFISQCSSKLAMTLNFIDLFKAFMSVPTSLALGHDKAIYSQIEANAKDLFKAEPVCLFQFTTSDTFKLVRLTESNDLKFAINEEQGTSGTKEPNMVVEVMKYKEIYVRNKDDYDKNWSPDRRGWKKGFFKNDFYSREGIESFAAILLEYNNTPLGVLFLNYRDRKHVYGFNDTFKRQFKIFAILATQGIMFAKLSRENNNLNGMNMRFNKPFVDSLILLGLIHGIENEALAAKDNLEDLEEELQNAKVDPDSKTWFTKELSFVSGPVKTLYNSLNTFRTFRNSRGEKFFFVEKSLVELVEETIVLVKAKADFNNINIDYKNLDGNKIILNIDINAVKHILLNFIFNAIESIADQKSWKRREIRIEYEALEKSNTILIKVSDSGPGISPEIRSRLFGSYQTTKNYGTGMGLSISRYLADINHGAIDFEEKLSDKGKWTSFILKLPLKNKF